MKVCYYDKRVDMWVIVSAKTVSFGNKLATIRTLNGEEIIVNANKELAMCYETEVMNNDR